MDQIEPELISKLLETCLNNGDIEGLQDLYETEAIFADYDGAAKGWSAIRAAHQRFVDAGLSLTLNDSLVFEVDDIALVHWSWTVQQADGSATHGTSAEVLRRQADGSWKFIIDNSDGSALVGHISK